MRDVTPLRDLGGVRVICRNCVPTRMRQHAFFKKESKTKNCRKGVRWRNKVVQWYGGMFLLHKVVRHANYRSPTYLRFLSTALLLLPVSLSRSLSDSSSLADGSPVFTWTTSYGQRVLLSTSSKRGKYE